jgi:predicted transcriptional regulator
MADTFSIRLPEDLRNEVDRLAEASRRSRAYIIKEAVEAYVAGQRAYEKAVDEALIEANKGVFVSGERVLAWLDELRINSNAPAPEPDVFKK